MGKGLTPKREAFAQGVASGKTQADAYRSAFSSLNMKPETVQQAASRLMADSKVAARVAELRKPVVEKVQITLESHLKRLNDLSLAAEKEGQFGASITAEISRGKASGLYTDKIDLSANIMTHGVLRVPGTVSESEWLTENGKG